MADTEHDKIAEKVAKALNTKYNRAKGPDINTPRLAAEVEVDIGKISEGLRQLQGFKKPRYIVIPDRHLKSTIIRTERLKTGVMDERGKIVKPARQPSKGKK